MLDYKSDGLIPYHRFEDCIKIVNYPSGEIHVSTTLPMERGALDREIVIEWNLRNWNDLMSLISINRTFVRNRIHVRWFIPFLPFARDDRRRTPGCANELDLALELLKPLDVLIADPHSYASEILAHIPQSTIVDFYRKQLFSPRQGVVNGPFFDHPVIVIPDQGAAHKVAKWKHPNEYFVQAQKVRDPHTGNLSNFHVPEFDFKDRPCIIVDDICDGGGTYIGLAKELRKQTDGPLRLAVTHGLFTKGIEPLLSAYNEVYFFDQTRGTMYDRQSGNRYFHYSWEDLYRFATGEGFDIGRVNGVI